MLNKTKKKTFVFFLQGILKLVLAGRMGEAIELTSRLYPGLLERDPNLMFALKCRQFVEMVNGSDSEVYQSNDNQTSVIQSTKAYAKPSTNGNVEEMNMNNAINGATTEQKFINGQIEDDVDMEDSSSIAPLSSPKNSNGYQNSNINNGFKHQNGEDVDMGGLLFIIYTNNNYSTGEISRLYYNDC